ncbi:lysosomal Pro-X carboxypeptidase [Bombina bombina]|uniref:lysosomal Pro-X carboxypeptidase n=1 Tax=Bombina bombina TaxID=8345 RepID=UPI00235ABD7C|nr:lysosomal Pro-X carboxypeptidase [Bombina bombina]
MASVVTTQLPGTNYLLLALNLLAACTTSVLSFQFISARQAQPSTAGITYKTYYFNQKIDQFGFAEDSTYKQRYLISDDHWKKPGGPILFYTGNEGDIALFCNNTGFMWDVAEEFGAMLVFAEHRYYGESLPFGDLSFSDPKHLNYLTSEQALADFAVLLRHLKGTIDGAQNSPVIAIGGSYGGMLAAWFRMKYPHVVVGALAASAPIWLFEDLVPCNSYYEIVTNDFKKSGPGCSESISNSWAAINRMAETGDSLLWLSNAFHLCSPLKSREDVAAFKGWLSETWVNLAMVDYPYPANFLEPLPAWPIQVVCKYLKNPKCGDKELLQNIFQAVNVYYNYTGNAECLNISQTSSGSVSDLGWSYQACTEMVMPLCSDGINDMFEAQPWDLQAYSDECYKQWGVRPRDTWITTMYGGKNISAHSNIVFSNGGLDPWSSGGVNENISDTLVAIVIPEGAHHLDLRSNNAYDPKSVLQARALEIQYMKRWIEQYKANKN